MPEPWTIRRVLDWTARELDRKGIASPRLDAEVLLAHVLGGDRVALYVDLDRPLDDDERAAFRGAVERRRRREPVAHITGTKEFWSLPIEVSPGVLVPRPETEVLVEECIEAMDGIAEAPLVVDVGTGTGCVALAIATERPAATVLAMDVSRSTVALARRNVARLELEGRVVPMAADLLGPVAGAVDLVVSNPPYIRSPEIEGLEPEVSRWEPRLALDGGADGLDVLRRLVDCVGRALRPGGVLAVEVGDDAQAEDVAGLLVGPLELLRVRQDYSGMSRVVLARRG